LRSLVSYQAKNPALPAGHPFTGGADKLLESDH
jgi:hypothetical protein